MNAEIEEILKILRDDEETLLYISKKTSKKLKKFGCTGFAENKSKKIIGMFYGMKLKLVNENREKVFKESL